MRSRKPKIVGRIASESELKQVRNFRSRIILRLSKRLRDIYYLPEKIKRRKVKKEKPGPSIEEMAKKYLGI